jgi:predicted RNase H-like HicB family nuclease
MKKEFVVVYEPDDGGWHTYIPAVKGCRTWGKTLSTARKNIREALSTCEDVYKDADAVARDAVFIDDIKLDAKVRGALTDAVEARAELEALQGELAAKTAAAARALTKGAGVSLGDAGELLGLSKERVRQVMEAKPRTTPVPGHDAARPRLGRASAGKPIRSRRPRLEA